MKYTWHFEVVGENIGFLLEGLGITVGAAVLAMATGVLAGLAVALARLSPWRLLSIGAQAYTEVFRTTPLLVQVVWVFYVLPLATGIVLSAFASGLLALSLNVAAFMAEIFRAGIVSVAPGQRSAGLALGMTGPQTLRRIILPQALARVAPPLASMWVSLFKDTAILSAIGVAELMFRTRYVAIQTYRPLELFTFVAVVYFVLAYPQSLIVNRLYERFRVAE